MRRSRRTDRLIKVASALAKNPSALLPCALETWGETLWASRFLENPAITYEQFLSPHWSQTYDEAMRCPRTLLGDTTEMDFTTHKAAKGLGPISNSREYLGFSLHTVLAMDPQRQRLLGCMTQELFLRKLAPLGEKKAQRKKRERESQVWERSVKQVGWVPQGRQWIYVGDSGSDIYTFWQTCGDLGYDFVLRIAQNRVVEILPEDLNEQYLKTLVRALPASSAHFLTIPAHHHQARSVFAGELPKSAGATAYAQSLSAQNASDGLDRACLGDAPPEGREPLEWILLSTIPIACPADGWQMDVLLSSKESLVS